MRFMCVCLGLVLLCGCAAPVWETVEDTVPVTATSPWTENTYDIQIGIPVSAELLAEREDWKVYAVQDSGLEIETRTFLTSGAEQAIKTVSGYEAEQLSVLQMSRFGLPEYQFAWVSQTEEGSRLYRAALVLDGMECYAVICSRPETAGGSCEQEIRQVFSSFGLFTDEGV